MGIPDWKRRLYETYLSCSGVSIPDDATDPASYFGDRAPYIRRFIKKYLPTDQSARIVDLGCGSGAYIHFLKEAGYGNVVGVDNSQEQVEAAHRLSITEVEHTPVRESLDNTPDNSVDIALVIDLLEHFTRADAFSLLEAIHRVLRPGGRCVAHVPNAEGVFGARIRYADLTHEQAFTRASCRQLFTSAGFSRLNCYGDKPPVHGLKSLSRRVIWELGTVPYRLLFAAETGETDPILSQNLVAVACTEEPSHA